MNVRTTCHILALLQTAGELLRQGLHTAEILEGYKRAFEKCMEELPSLVCHTVEDVRDKAQLVYAIKTTLASKQYGFEVSALTVYMNQMVLLLCCYYRRACFYNCSCK
jgi:chaperonin GroEL (HSP60 family)